MRIGVDLGGTKIEAIALDERGRELRRQRVSTPRGDYGATLETIRLLVDGLERTFGRAASIGIGHPGATSRATGLMKNANSTWLNGQPFERDIASALERPVACANDADCFALSEATDGAAAGADIVFGVIVGTGTGGAIVHGGRLLSGINAIAGEWGHNPMPWPTPAEWPGPPCYCGRTGCIETFLSGPGLSLDFRKSGGADLPALDIALQAEAGEPRACGSLERYSDRMARALASVINIVDPHVIVLGGGMSNIAPLYEMVPARWDRYVFSDRVDTRLVPPTHGDSSGVRGAAWLGERATADLRL
ncbi:MAG: ROK family protein [Acidobacteria bacterium]|nr:ROK family protein [Acidobacteriota bacterium]